MSACDGADLDVGMCTFAAMGAVGQVLGADDEALFVLLCGAVGGGIIAGTFCYGHVVMCRVWVYDVVVCQKVDGCFPANGDFFDFYLEMRERKNVLAPVLRDCIR